MFVSGKLYGKCAFISERRAFQSALLSLLCSWRVVSVSLDHVLVVMLKSVGLWSELSSESMEFGKRGHCYSISDPWYLGFYYVGLDSV